VHFRSEPYMHCVKTALQEFQPPLAMWHSNTMSVYLAGSARSKHLFNNDATFKVEGHPVKVSRDEVHHRLKYISKSKLIKVLPEFFN
jgi:hypothetical protein